MTTRGPGERPVASRARRAVGWLALGSSLVAGCAADGAVGDTGLVRDAERCEADADQHMPAGQNDPHVRLLMIESCMALLGRVAR